MATRSRRSFRNARVGHAPAATRRGQSRAPAISGRADNCAATRSEGSALRRRPRHREMRTEEQKRGERKYERRRHDRPIVRGDLLEPEPGGEDGREHQAREFERAERAATARPLVRRPPPRRTVRRRRRRWSVARPWALRQHKSIADGDASGKPGTSGPQATKLHTNQPIMQRRAKRADDRLCPISAHIRRKSSANSDATSLDAPGGAARIAERTGCRNPAIPGGNPTPARAKAAASTPMLD